MSPYCALRCVGVAVDTGEERTSRSASSRAHPCWLVPCRSHKLDRTLKSPHIVIVSPSSSSVSSRNSQLAPVVQVEGVHVCIEENQGFVLLTCGFLFVSFFVFRMPCSSRDLVQHLSKLREDAVLLRSFRTTSAKPWP